MSIAKTIPENRPPIHKPRTWGFRFSSIDVLVIGLFLCATAILWHLNSPLWWMLLITAAHFFLFCNVFRIVRRLELIWATTFILNIGAWAWLNHLNWLFVLVCQLPLTLILLIAGIRSPGYHGIFANRLNPKLNEYLGERRIAALPFR